MNLSCGSRTIKYLMFAFNLFFVISGIIIIAVGATVKAEYSQYADILNSQYFSLPNMLIATGVFIFIISFLGCCGAFKESWIMLGIFSILLGIIFIFELASGIAGYVLRDKTQDYLDSTLRRDLLLYKNSTYVAWDLIQTTFQCCGVVNYTDWDTVLDNYDLPLSCCPAKSGTNGVFYCNSYDSSFTTMPPSNVDASIDLTTADTAETPTSVETSTTVNTSSTTDVTSTTVSTPTTVSTTTPTTNSSATPSAPSTTTTISSSSSATPSAPSTTTTISSATPSAPSTTTPYSTGCKSAFGEFIKKHAVQIGGCAIGLAVIQILGIGFSCHLVRQLRSGNL